MPYIEAPRSTYLKSPEEKKRIRRHSRSPKKITYGRRKSISFAKNDHLRDRQNHPNRFLQKCLLQKHLLQKHLLLLLLLLKSHFHTILILNLVQLNHCQLIGPLVEHRHCLILTHLTF